MTDLQALKEDARQRPFMYLIYLMQIVLVATFARMLLDLSMSLNEQGCRFAVKYALGGALG